MTITSDPMIKPVVVICGTLLDLALVGIGHSNATHGSAFMRANSGTDKADNENSESAGDVCRQMPASPVRAFGKLVLNLRLIAMSLEQLKRVPMVVAIAGGR